MSINSKIAKIDIDLIKRLTKDLVEFDSQNPPGKCDHIAQYLKEIGKDLGFKTQIFEMDNNRHNIVLSYGEGEKDIVLSGHLDTVPIGDEKQWKYPPLEVTDIDGKLFGRGTVDMKGGVASLIAVMEVLSRFEVDLNHRLVFVGTADEEVGMNGAFHLKEKGVMNNAECLIITEATDLKVGIAEKGPYWIRVKVKGKAAHGSMPEVGINAIEGSCKCIEQLKNYLPSINHELLGKSTLNVGLIQGGTKINVVPEDCSFDCDYRLVPGVAWSEFNLEIINLLKEISSNQKFTISHELIHTIPALSTSKDNPLVQSLLKWSQTITMKESAPIGLTYGTDAAALIPPQDIPFIIIGGGHPSVLHQANEYVHLNDLVKASKIITAGIIDVYQEKK
ncbi:MAG: M20 family metallopeptidase [Candidatus Heimdallarchaeota archaeon]|nr:M20 family metallopeptidase [Candidatus Heimdallarchaeota archaeon]